MSSLIHLQETCLWLGGVGCLAAALTFLEIETQPTSVSSQAQQKADSSAIERNTQSTDRRPKSLTLEWRQAPPS